MTARRHGPLTATAGGLIQLTADRARHRLGGHHLPRLRSAAGNPPAAFPEYRVAGGRCVRGRATHQRVLCACPVFEQSSGPSNLTLPDLGLGRRRSRFGRRRGRRVGGRDWRREGGDGVGGLQVRDLTTWTIVQHDGPNQLGLRCNAPPLGTNGPDHLGLCARRPLLLCPDQQGLMGMHFAVRPLAAAHSRGHSLSRAQPNTAVHSRGRPRTLRANAVLTAQDTAHRSE